MKIDLTPYGHVSTRGRIIAANNDAIVVDTSHGLALCDNPLVGNPLASLVGDIDVMQACPHGLRGVVRVYMRSTRRLSDRHLMSGC